MCMRDRIIRYAKGVIGCAYDRTPSGGVEGNSYNCSYLTFCAYRYAGLEIPRWQGHQNGDGSQSDWVRWNDNWKWNVNELVAGDLVFYGSSPYHTTHVGIYVGDGMQIDSIPDGGVQKRFIYDTFVGGGWPFPFEQEERVVRSMCGFIEVDGSIIYYDGRDLHYVSEPECLAPMNAMATAFTGEPLRTISMSEDDYARICEVIRAGFPVHLHDLNTRYEPR